MGCRILSLPLPFIILGIALFLLLGLIGFFVVALLAAPVVIATALLKPRRRKKGRFEDGGRTIVLGEDEYEVLD